VVSYGIFLDKGKIFFAYLWCTNIEGSILNNACFASEAIHYLTVLFFELDYCVRPVPFLFKKIIIIKKSF